MVIGRKQVATFVAEFLGVGLLTLTYLSVQRSTIGIAYFVAIAAGAAVAATAYFFGDVSGAHMNPAITLALWTARKVGTVTAALYLVFQVLGAWTAYGVYHYLVGSGFASIGGHYSAHVLIAEALGTFVLALAWGAASVRKMETGSRAFLLGGSYALAIIIAAVTGVGFGVANPALALGVRAWAFAGSMGWGTYVAGPVLGALIGVNLYMLLFADSKSTGNGKMVAAEAVTTSSASSSRATRGKKKTSTAKKKTTRR
jgi:glycerol uptake facilitator protein